MWVFMSRNTAFGLVSQLARQFGPRGGSLGVYPGGYLHTHKHKKAET